MIGSRALGASRQGGNAVDVSVAALAGLSIAFLAFAAPSDLLASLVGSTGLPSILPAAEPPLGLKARVGLGGAGAVLVFGLAFGLLRWLNRFGSAAADQDDEPEAAEPHLRRRRRDLHPDAPARAPLATEELGEPSLDPWPVRQTRSSHEPERRSGRDRRSESWSEPQPSPEAALEPAAARRPVADPEPSADDELVLEPGDAMESAWALSRPYDPVVHVKRPSHSWSSNGEHEPVEPYAEAEDAEWSAVDEAEEEARCRDPWDPDPEDEPAPSSAAWGFEEDPEPAPAPHPIPQAEAVPEPEPVHAPSPVEPRHAEPGSVAAPEEPVAPAPVRYWSPEPQAAAEPERPADPSPVQDNSIDGLLARLEQGLVRRRSEPASSAGDVPAPPPPAPPAAPLDPADHRLQNAIDHLQRLAARRD